MRTTRLAIVHDHLTQLGGAEQVVQVMRAMYPAAPLYTLAYDERRLGGWFRGADVRTSFLQRLPGATRFLKAYLPLMPMATESLDLRGYDVVLSSASSFAKGIVTDKATRHICYCHTPTRYLWGESQQYIDELPYPWFVRRAAALTLPRLRAWDRAAADRPTIMVANSEAVRQRIQKYYGRESHLLYPPVDTARFHPAEEIDNFFLTGGRLVSYKRFDIVVEAFNRMKRPLKIFGVGPDARRLMAMAGPTIQFLGFVSNDELAGLYRHAAAFIHPQEEDFGITAVEAMASGRPVIAYAAGGALETVVEGKTGTFIDEQSWEALGDAVLRFRSADYDAAVIRQRAERFGVEAFITGLRRIMENVKA